jgi:hypothetical protein
MLPSEVQIKPSKFQLVCGILKTSGSCLEHQIDLCSGQRGLKMLDLGRAGRVVQEQICQVPIKLGHESKYNH